METVALQRYFGWKSIDTALSYVHLSGRHVLDAARAASPALPMAHVEDRVEGSAKLLVAQTGSNPLEARAQVSLALPAIRRISRLSPRTHTGGRGGESSRTLTSRRWASGTPAVKAMYMAVWAVPVSG